jgi:hypothetical protein
MAADNVGDDDEEDLSETNNKNDFDNSFDDKLSELIESESTEINLNAKATDDLSGTKFEFLFVLLISNSLVIIFCSIFYF